MTESRPERSPERCPLRKQVAVARVGSVLIIVAAALFFIVKDPVGPSQPHKQPTSP